MWTLWRATDKKYLPSELLAEPQQPITVLLEIDSIYEKMVGQLRSKEPDGGEG